MSKRSKHHRPPKPAPPRPAAAPASPASPAVPPPKPPPAPAGASLHAPAPLPKATIKAGVADRRFWTGFEIPWAKLVVFRFVFFALLAVDAFLQLAHAPRYGAGGFNVQHLAGAPLPDPSRPAMTALYAALCIGFALIAQGALVRVLLPIATVLYGYTYFVSQLDSYQHHYLVWLLLVLLCFVPRRPDPAPASASPGATRFVRSWALRLVLVQLAIVYFYAAVSKMDPLWLDGTTLSRQVRPGTIRDALTALGWYPVAMGVIAGELFVAATVWWKRLWPYALAVGVGLHLGIELIGLEIGLFSYLMFALYLLVVPDQVFGHVARLGRSIAAHWDAIPRVARIGVAVVLAGGGLGWLAIGVPLVHGVLVAALVVGLLAAVVTTIAWGDRGHLARRIAVVGVAALVPVAVDAMTDTSRDYYRYWAGAARRMGDDAGARQAYLGLLGVEPSSEYAHYYLGQLDANQARYDAALAHYQAAQRSKPDVARSFVGEAGVRMQQGAQEPARAALERALAIDPGDAQARSLMGMLSTDHPAEEMAPPPAAPPADHDDDR